MSRRMWTMAAAVLVAATLGVAVAVATSGESCDAWKERDSEALALMWTKQISEAEFNAVHDARPEGCAPEWR